MIVVTGGAGFIGSNLVRCLAGGPEAVAVIERVSPGHRWRNLEGIKLADIVAINQAATWLTQHVEEITALVHLGAISSTTCDDPKLLQLVNIDFTTELAASSSTIPHRALSSATWPPRANWLMVRAAP